MCSPVVLATMIVELRHNTSKSSFESNVSGNKLRTRFRFVSTFHCRSPSKWKQEETVWIHVRTSLVPDAFGRKPLNAWKALPIDADSLRRRDPQLEKTAPACGSCPNRRNPQGEVPGFHSAGCDLQVCESARTMEKEGSPREPTCVQDLEHSADSFIST